MAQLTMIAAAILTRNRRELLRHALTAVMEQTRPVDRLLVVDNDSDDGTSSMLARDFPSVGVVRLPENRGSAGGFYEAIRAGFAEPADWLWLMDDDSIAGPRALEELLDGLERAREIASPDLLCGRVEWADGQPHPMNRANVRRRDGQLLVDAAKRGLLPVRAATWVSLLISRAAVERAGLPLRQYFFQTDDIEYTARILRDGHGFYVPRSVVEHRTATKHTAVDDHHRFFFHTRNTVLLFRGRAFAPSEKPAIVAWSLVATTMTYLRLNRPTPANVWRVVRAIVAGLRSPAR